MRRRSVKIITINPEEIVAVLIGLARAYPGQLVGIIASDDGEEEIEVGVLSLIYPEDGDWFQRSVPLEGVPQAYAGLREPPLTQR